MFDSAQILRRLGAAGHQITASRQMVVEAVAAQPNRFTANELCATVARWAPSIGRATIFRTLDLLERLGVLGRVHSLGDCASYVICEGAQHHHHLVCSGCGTVTDVQGCGLSGLIQSVAEQHAFRVEGHLVEIFGRCRTCLEGGSDVAHPHP